MPALLTSLENYKNKMKWRTWETITSANRDILRPLPLGSVRVAPPPEAAGTPSQGEVTPVAADEQSVGISGWAGDWGWQLPAPSSHTWRAS